MKNSTDTITWLVAATLTALITWSAHRHHMPVFQTLTIGLSVLYATKAGADTIARSITAARQNRTSR